MSPNEPAREISREAEALYLNDPVFHAMTHAIGGCLATYSEALILDAVRIAAERATHLDRRPRGYFCAHCKMLWPLGGPRS
jgi:hypothetical protein